MLKRTFCIRHGQECWRQEVGGEFVVMSRAESSSIRALLVQDWWWYYY
jgi:hypothetical protein